jgi:hypothetical protein
LLAQVLETPAPYRCNLIPGVLLCVSHQHDCKRGISYKALKFPRHDCGRLTPSRNIMQRNGELCNLLDINAGPSCLTYAAPLSLDGKLRLGGLRERVGCLDNLSAHKVEAYNHLFANSSSAVGQGGIWANSLCCAVHIRC